MRSIRSEHQSDIRQLLAKPYGGKAEERKIREERLSVRVANSRRFSLTWLVRRTRRANTVCYYDFVHDFFIFKCNALTSFFISFRRIEFSSNKMNFHRLELVQRESSTASWANFEHFQTQASCSDLRFSGSSTSCYQSYW